MNTQKSHFNRNLLYILVILYVLTIGILSYAIWSQESETIQWWMMLLNILILSIPLVLIFALIYVLVSAWREHSTLGQVSSRRTKIIHWAPRLAAILIIFFLSLFSLDVFEIKASPLELLVGFLVHNIPSISMLILLIFAWKRPVVGFVAFLVAAALFAIFFVRSIYSLSNLMLFVFPILLIALLFYVEWKWLTPKSQANNARDA